MLDTASRASSRSHLYGKSISERSYYESKTRKKEYLLVHSVVVVILAAGRRCGRDRGGSWCWRGIVATMFYYICGSWHIFPQANVELGKNFILLPRGLQCRSSFHSQSNQRRLGSSWMGARDADDASSGMLFSLFLSIFFSLVRARTVTTMAMVHLRYANNPNYEKFGTFDDFHRYPRPWGHRGPPIFFYLVEYLKVGVL
jgi:hypothetical protein